MNMKCVEISSYQLLHYPATDNQLIDAFTCPTYGSIVDAYLQSWWKLTCKTNQIELLQCIYISLIKIEKKKNFFLNVRFIHKICYWHTFANNDRARWFFHSRNTVQKSLITTRIKCYHHIAFSHVIIRTIRIKRTHLRRTLTFNLLAYDHYDFCTS